MAPTSWLRAAALAAGLFAAGCHAGGINPAGHASDQWVRSYELPPDGEIQVSATNGAIELEGYDGPTVEVRAERVAHAASDDAARELVSRIEIKEEVLPNRVSISTEGISGILIGVSYEVKYQVRAPHSVVARLRVTNGVVKAKAFAGIDRDEHQRRDRRRGAQRQGRGAVDQRQRADRAASRCPWRRQPADGQRTRRSLAAAGGKGRPLRRVPQRCGHGRRAGDRGVWRTVPPRRQRPSERRRPAGRRRDDERRDSHPAACQTEP